jgi:hypothetical protein
MYKTLKFNSWLEVQKNAQFKIITFNPKDGKLLMVQRIFDKRIFSLRFYDCESGNWNISSVRILEFCDDLIHVKGSVSGKGGYSTFTCEINDIIFEDNLIAGLKFKPD